MEGSLLERAGARLLDLLCEAAVPACLASRDDIRMAAPYQTDQDFRIGVYLYDIQDFSQRGSTGLERVNHTQRRPPPKSLELHYLIFANQQIPFSGSGAQEEARLLEGAVRAVYDNPSFSLDGSESVRLSFSLLKISEKLALWQSFSKPLQPAVYATLSPVLIPSSRIFTAPEVREITYRYPDGEPEQKIRAAHPAVPEEDG